jgi:NAD(P)H-dependent flavin oxidoreductase YrpB (nitropropane dioxygenase family)
MLETELTWIEEQTDGKPFGVDLLLPPKYVGADEGGITADQVRALLPPEHQAFLDDLLARYAIPPKDTGRMPVGAGLNVSPKGYEPLLDVAFAHPIKLIASALGPPPPDLVSRAHDRDVVVAALAVAPVPVIAAGGIARGRQVAAAFALGAQGVWCGSVWLTTEEAETTPVVKEKFLAASSSDTVRSRSLTGKPARMLRTAWTDEWEREDTPDPLGMPLQTALTAEPQFRIQQAASQPDATKARELATWFVGQVVGSMTTVRPARAVVLDMVEEFIDVVQDLGRYLHDDATA